jgi:hypothetical protein
MAGVIEIYYITIPKKEIYINVCIACPYKICQSAISSAYISSALSGCSITAGSFTVLQPFYTYSDEKIRFLQLYFTKAPIVC